DQPLEAKVEDKTIVLSRKAMVVSSRNSLLGQQLIERIRGFITDTNGVALAAATITLLNADQTATGRITVSDQLGRFEFKGVPSNAWLLITNVGYEQRFINLADKTDNQPIEIRLNQKETLIEDVSVTVNT